MQQPQQQAQPAQPAAARAETAKKTKRGSGISWGSSRAWFRGSILCSICLAAFLVRLFAVIRYESVIHEYDPYFNFRATEFLARHGLYEWWNWYDARSWYPLGRVVGQTLFPGLMTTGYVLWRFLHAFGFPVHIRDVCVFLAPVFAGATCLSVYWLARLSWPGGRGSGCSRSEGSGGAGLLAAAFMAVVPSYISRSVAGSYDNEAVAIFALVYGFACYCNALRLPAGLPLVWAAVAYLYMVASWGGYVFITNTVAIHMLATLLLGRATARHFAVYSVFHVLGTVFCLNIPFVGTQAITSSEHLASHGVFLLVQVLLVYQRAARFVPPATLRRVVRLGVGALAAVLGGGYLWLVLSGRTQFSGRSLTLLDPTYAGKHVPIVASVSEHQPPTWFSYLFDLSGLTIFTPVGLWLLLRAPDSDGALLVGIYGVLAAYFSCVMVRLMLVLSPAACILAGIAISHTLYSLRTVFRAPAGPEAAARRFVRRMLAAAALAWVVFAAVKIWISGVHVSAVAYSNPSIVLSGYTRTGERVIQDDFREAYYWMRHNTPVNSRIMSWWDYGYQSAAMADRTVIVDNNTWNTTHIATVGLAFALPEKEAYDVVAKLDVDYVFVVFGGFAGYPSDDINKFAWMVKIAAGVYPSVKESDYFNPWTVGPRAPPALKSSLMYRLSFHRFSEGPTRGFDYVRREQVPDAGKLAHFEEAYTTENWMVRIFRVKKASELVLVEP